MVKSKPFIAFIGLSLGGFGLHVHGLESLSDPTAPLGYELSAERKVVFTLNSIFKSVDGAKAIVNGKLLSVGESVGSATLLTINDASVVIKTHDGVQTLVLHRQIKKNSATQ